MTDFHDLEYEELKQMHRDIGQLLHDKKEEALEKIRGTMENLGFTIADLAVKKTNGKKEPAQVKYKNEETGETWSGRGQRPKWIQDMIAEGRQLSEFLSR